MKKTKTFQKRDSEQNEIRELFDFLYISEKHLTGGQVIFIQSLKKQFIRDKALSNKQLAALRDIKKYLPVAEPRYTNHVDTQ